MKRSPLLLALAQIFALLVVTSSCSSELGGGGSAGPSSPGVSSAAPATAPMTTPLAAPVSAPGAALRPGAPGAPTAGPISCHDGRALTVHFYDVGQALAALVDLPDGRHLLVDAGDAPHRSGCEACEMAHAHLEAELRKDLAGSRIDVLWNTHPHSDHVGGVASVLLDFPVAAYVDNGRGTVKPEVRAAREAAARRGVTYIRMDPKTVGDAIPLLSMLSPPLPKTAPYAIRPILPPAWPASCARDENECSLGLRIDFCDSSILFTGDAEHQEEARLDPLGPATLLQVGHHGSDTSTSARFLDRVAPRYAVVSAGDVDDDRNREYCHPRALAIRRLSAALVAHGGGGEDAHLEAYEGTCQEAPEGRAARSDTARPGGWIDVSVSGRLFATERDGDVVLTTTGDGKFSRR